MAFLPLLVCIRIQQRVRSVLGSRELISCKLVQPVPARVEETVSPVRSSSSGSATNNPPFPKKPARESTSRLSKLVVYHQCVFRRRRRIRLIIILVYDNIAATLSYKRPFLIMNAKLYISVSVMCLSKAPICFKLYLENGRKSVQF